MRILPAGVFLLVSGFVSAAGETPPWQGFTVLALSVDGQFFATGGRLGEVQLRETSTGELIGRWDNPEGSPVVGLTLEPKGGRVGWVGSDRIARVAPAGGASSILKSSDPLALPLAAAADLWFSRMPLVHGVTGTRDGWEFHGDADGRITVLSPGGTPATWVGHQAAVTGLALVPDHSLLVSSAIDGTLCLWSPVTGQLLGSL